MASEKRPAAPLTATRFMTQQAELPTEFHKGQTAQEHVDAWVNNAVEQAKNGETIGCHAVTRMHAVRYTIAIGGPCLDVTFVFAYPEDQDLDYVVVDYHEGGPRAQRVITGWAAQRLYRALRDGDDD